MYTDSLVVFLDILGLTDRIKESETDPSEAQRIADMLGKVQEMTSLINKRAKPSWKMDIVAHAFSDSVLISCPTISEKAFIHMAHLIAAIQFEVMRHQFFLRGGMSAGGHYERQGVAFGPAFVQAYEIEKLSFWPRVLINPLVFEKIGRGAVLAALESYISRDENGLCYFNYLHLLVVQQWLRQEKEPPANDEVIGLDSAEPLRKHKQYLLSAVERLKRSLRFDLLAKYHAVADYHNRYVRESYQDLPTQGSYKEVDPTTITGQIISGIKTLASSQQGITDENIDAMLDLYTQVLRKARRTIQECEIDLGVVFRPLYSHLDQD